MPDENKSSTLADQIKSAQESINTWPEWLRDSAKFSGQPGAQRDKPRSDQTEPGDKQDQSE